MDQRPDSHDLHPSQAPALESDPSAIMAPANLSVGESALAYCEAGYHLLPLHGIKNGLCCCGKDDCKSPGKHPIAGLAPSGLKDASSDPAVIERWWKAQPNANIGIATGKLSGLCVLDIDGEEGENMLISYEAVYGALAPTREVRTGRGRHLYFKYPDGAERVASAASDGFDVRGDGGYVVAPPSTHKSGRKYNWAKGEATDLAPFPVTITQFKRKLSDNSQVPNDKSQSHTVVAAADELFSADTTQTPYESLNNEELMRLERALSFVPADDRGTWLTVGMALHSTGWGEPARLLWDKWSQKSEKFDVAGQERTWQSFDRDYEGPKVTIASIFELCKQSGGTITMSPQEPVQLSLNSAIYQSLAKLPLDAYDRVRVAEADKLCIRVSTLDGLVDDCRPADDEVLGSGRKLELPMPEQWHLPVDGADLCTAILTEISKFVLMTDEARMGVALWCLHAHAVSSALMSPRLAITSPEKRCGKTTLLRLIQCLVPKPLPAANITSAALFRTVEVCRPTLLIDEADSFLHENEELRGIINSGHGSDGQVVRLVGENHEPRAFSTFCPTVIAAIGNLPGTIEDRSISISLRRRRDDEAISRFRFDRTETLQVLCRKMARWVADHTEVLKGSDPDVPSGLHDRAADNWRPLLAIADSLGGEWPKLARSAAVKLSSSTLTQEESLQSMLLADIRNIFLSDKVDRLGSQALVEKLVTIVDRPWATFNRGKAIDPAWVARKLKPYGIKPGTIRTIFGSPSNGEGSTPTVPATKTEETRKGYYLSDFDDAFARYLEITAVTPSQYAIM